jgi:hypothetical protein
MTSGDACPTNQLKHGRSTVALMVGQPSPVDIMILPFSPKVAEGLI